MHIDKLIIAKDASIESWRVDGVDVLHPRFKLANGKIRGSSHVCVPVFGKMPDHMRKLGCNLPQHGLVRWTEANPVVDDGHARTMHFSFPERTIFAWEHYVRVRIEQDDHTLTHQLLLARETECSNEDGMPFSLGFHPYFSTHGGAFEIRRGLIVIESGSIKKSKSIYFGRLVDHDVHLVTSRGTIKVVVHGYDGYNIWTDDIAKYICVEPVYQKGKFGKPGYTMGKGEEFNGYCSMTFDPNATL